MELLQAKVGGWGAVGVGRWVELAGTSEVGGVCYKCNTLRPAADLYHRPAPFGKAGGWVGSCCDVEMRKPKTKR